MIISSIAITQLVDVMSAVKVWYAIWNRRDEYDANTRNILVDMDFALDSIIVPYVHKDLHHILGYMADQTDYTHLVVYSSGTGIRKTYALDTEWHRHCSQNWLVSGHIMLKENDQYPRLHDQSFAINLRLWKDLGRPEIGWRQRGDKTLPAYMRSQENIHDDYTPLWLKSCDGHVSTDRRGFGWNIIAKSLENGIDVPNIPIKIRKQKFYIYPDDNSENLVAAVASIRSDPTCQVPAFPNDSQLDFIDWLRIKLQSTKTPVFIYNTGLLWYDSNFDDVPDSIWTTASGFKNFVEWFMRGAPSNCCINTYDYNQDSLNLWQHIHKHWQGNDLYSLLLSYDADCENEESYCWGNKLADETIQQASSRQELELVQYFGSRENMQKYWKLFQGLEHRYHHCNIVTEHQKILDNLPQGKSHYLWVNNIFFFRQNIIQYGLNHLNESLCDLIDAINAKAPDSYMFGQCSKFYFGHNVNDISGQIRAAVEHQHQWDMDHKP